MSHRVINLPKRPSIGSMSGAAMDKPAPPRRRNWTALALAALVPLGAVITLWTVSPSGIRVPASELRIATVQRGLFHNDLIFRATAEPLHTVLLDAQVSGRVEEVAVTDGTLVKKGDLLFRLSNPQLRLDLVAREADRAQQISNLSILRVSIESGATEHQRRMLDLRYELDQARKQHARLAVLARDGVIPGSTLEEAQDLLARHRQALVDETARFEIEARIKRDGVRQMEQAIDRLDAGLAVVTASIDSLDVRAPLDGRLTDFKLQLGEIVKPEQRLGRIDDPRTFKLTARVDEYFLRSVAPGKTGEVSAGGRDYAVTLSRVFPQITEGRFGVELRFPAAPPEGMYPGQSVETRLTLGGATPALFLPNDSFLTDTGGSWAFVLDADGTKAARRIIRTGRRNNRQVEVLSGLDAGDRVVVSGYASFGKTDQLQIIH